MPLSRVLANAYIGGGRDVAIETTPGRRLPFRGGVAEVIDERDMPVVLRMENARVEVDPSWRDFFPRWVEQCDWRRPARATVVMQGYEVGPPPTYDTPRPDLEALQPVEEITGDPGCLFCARAHKGYCKKHEPTPQAVDAFSQPIDEQLVDPPDLTSWLDEPDEPES